MDIRFMKKCTFALAILAATTATSYAFQIPSFQSPRMPFTGAYAGLNAGYSFGKSHTVTETSFVDFGWFGPDDVQQINSYGIHDLNLNSFTGGGQLGYNYEFCTKYGNFLIGAETDFSSLSGVSTSNTSNELYVPVNGAGFVLYTKTTANWLFTLRPRIGYIYKCTLFYLTGGLAIAQFETYNSFNDHFAGFDPATAANSSEYASHTSNESAATFGGGIEYMFTQNLSVKAEYLYAKFGNISANGKLTVSPAIAFAADVLAQNPFTHTADFSTNIFRLGLNYNFS